MEDQTVQMNREDIRAIVDNTHALQRLLISSSKANVLDGLMYENIGAREQNRFEDDDELTNREQKIRELQWSRAIESIWTITGFSFLVLILMSIYIGWAWLNFSMIHGYPSLHVPGSPGPFVTQRYTPMHIFVYMLIFNVLPPIALLLVAAFPIKITPYTLHGATTLLALVANVISGIGLLVLWWWFCNSRNAYNSVLANDVCWCCVHYAFRPIECGFNMDCIPGFCPAVRMGLHAPLEYRVSIVVAWVGVLFTYFHFVIAGKLHSWGVWRTAIRY